MAKEKKYNGFKLKISKWLLGKNLSTMVRFPKSCSLEKASTVGVTFAATSPEHLENIKKLLKELANMGVQTYTLGYIPEKKPSDFYLSEKAFNFFFDKELDWLLRPKNQAAMEFEATEFDILIDFGGISFFPMHALISKSKARFKVGLFTEDGPFDLMINIKDKKDYKYYFDQVIHYLSKFNN
jgi:hypothetical protein